MSQGELWWSHYEVHPWADHFTPSIGILAPFFWIYPHFIWVVLAKILSYTLVPLGFWQLAKISEPTSGKSYCSNPIGQFSLVTLVQTNSVQSMVRVATLLFGSSGHRFLFSVA